jgi:hypothetical protein
VLPWGGCKLCGVERPPLSSPLLLALVLTLAHARVLAVQAMYKNAGAAGAAGAPGADGGAGAAEGSADGKEKVVDADFEDKTKK